MNKQLIQIWLLLLMVCLGTSNALATAFVSTGTGGNWASPGTWTANSGFPAAGDTAEIVNGATVTTAATAACAGVKIDNGGKLVLSKALTVNHGTSPDLDCHGTVDTTIASGLTLGANATATIESDGTFIYDIATGTIVSFGSGATLAVNGTFNVAVNISTSMTIPTATWASTSTIEFTGETSGTSTLSGMGQTFGNVLWNCPSQTATAGALLGSTAGTFTFAGNFTVTSTGTGTLTLANISSPAIFTLNLGGNFSIASGAAVGYSTKNTASVINAINFTGTGTINVSGSLYSGTTSSAEGEQVAWTINSASIMTLTHNWTLAGQPSQAAADADSLTVNGTLNCSTFQILNNAATGTENNTFTLASSGTLGLGDPFGITASTTGSSGGNIQVKGTRTYTSGASFTYNGTAAQAAGAALPTTIHNLSISNATGVTLTSGSSTYTVSSAFAATYASGTASLGLNGNTLALGTDPVTITVSGSALTPANYTIASGTVTGTAPTPTVNGVGAPYSPAPTLSYASGMVLTIVPTVSAANSTVSASLSSVPADGTTTSTITVTLNNSSSAPVSGKTVTLAKTSGPGSPTIITTQGTTDSSGHATFTVSSTTAGTDVFTATDTSENVTVTQTASVAFTAGTPTAAQSTVIASPGSVPADGTSASTVTVTLNDLYGNPVSGKTVTLAQTSGPGSPTINTTQGTTDSSGHAIFTVTSTATGTDGFTATDTSDSVTVSQTASVAFTAVPNAGTSTVSASPPSVTADGSTISTITVTVKDSGGNPIQGATVALSDGSPTGVTLTQPGSTTASNGQTTGTITATKAQSVNISASVGVVNITQTAGVTFIAGTPTAAQSTVSPSPSSVTADGSTTSTITVTLNDANGNPASGKTVTLAKTSGPGTPNIITTQGTTDSNGHATFTVSSTTAGTDVFTATDTSDTVTVTATASVAFTAGLVTKLQFLLPGETAAPGTVSGKTGSPNASLTGIAFNATVNAVDANWNVVSSATPTVNFTSTDGAATLPANGSTTLVAGTKTVSVILNTPGSQTVTANDAGSVLTSSTSAATTVSPINVVTLTVSSNGVSPWTVPPGVTSIQVQMWGGGGAGGGALNNNVAFGGGGGGGGGYTLATLSSLTPGSTLAYSVGSGGTGAAGANGTAGTNTTFAGATTANGGGGGLAPGTPTGGTGGTGGTFNGGTGTTGTTALSGGGGEGAGTGANGQNGSGTTGGSTSAGGGAGGNGFTSSASTGAAGNVPGGGGSGAFEHGTTARAGGAGGNGEIVITYAVATANFSSVASSQSIHYGQTPITLSGTLSAPGPMYPPNGETVTVTINGNAQNTTINDSTGDFSIAYNPSTIPASGTPYTITYSFAGDAALSRASDTTTTLTVNKATTSVLVTSSANPSVYGSSVTFTSTLPASATGNVIFETNGVVLSTNAISAGIATTNTTLLSLGTDTVTVLYAGDTDYLGSTNSLAGGELVIGPPAIGHSVTNTVNSGTLWKISILSLSNAAAWTDPNSYPMTLSSVGPTSLLGTNVTSDGTYIYYGGPVTANDSFSYVISNGYLTTTGSVSLVASAVAQTGGSISGSSLSFNGGGHPAFSGNGIPGLVLGVESAVNANGPWSEAGNVTVGSNGSWNFTDPNQTNPSMIFYRMYYPDNPSSPPQ